MFGIVYGSDSDNKIMNRFVDEYELWCNEGKNPDIASIDLDFALDLQKKRLDEKGVRIQTAFTDKETVKDETPVNACTAYDMGECKSNIATKTYEVTEKYFKDGKKKKKIKPGYKKKIDWAIAEKNKQERKIERRQQSRTARKNKKNSHK